MTSDMWHVTCDMWHVTCDMWQVNTCLPIMLHIFGFLMTQGVHKSIQYVTSDKWHVTCDIWHMTLFMGSKKKSGGKKNFTQGVKNLFGVEKLPKTAWRKKKLFGRQISPDSEPKYNNCQRKLRQEIKDNLFFSSNLLNQSSSPTLYFGTNSFNSITFTLRYWRAWSDVWSGSVNIYFLITG